MMMWDIVKIQCSILGILGGEISRHSNTRSLPSLTVGIRIRTQRLASTRFHKTQPNLQIACDWIVIPKRLCGRPQTDYLQAFLQSVVPTNF